MSRKRSKIQRFVDQFMQRHKERLGLIFALIILGPIFVFIIFIELERQVPFPYKKGPDWEKWISDTAPRIMKIVSQGDDSTQSYLNPPVVIIRHFAWPYQNAGDKEAGDGPFLFTSVENASLKRKEMIKNGVFANSPLQVRSVVWLSIDSHAKIHSEYVWRGPSPLHGSSPVTVERSLIATVIDLDSGRLIDRDSWDCSYDIAPGSTRLMNEKSLGDALAKMENWLAFTAKKIKVKGR